MGDSGDRLLCDDLLHVEERGAAERGAADLEGHHTGGAGQRTGGRDSQGGGGGAAEAGLETSPGIDPFAELFSAEANKRSRVLRCEVSDRLLIHQPHTKRGWKRKEDPTTTQALKDDISALSNTIRSLTKEHGRTSIEVSTAVARMSELRALLPTSAPKKQKREVPREAASVVEAPRAPVTTDCNVAYFLRSGNPMSETLASRAACGCQNSHSLLDDIVVHNRARTALPDDLSCTTCLWNWVSHLTLSDNSRHYSILPDLVARLNEALKGSGLDDAVHAKMLLAQGVLAELRCDVGAQALYSKAVGLDVGVAEAYFGMKDVGEEQLSLYEDFRIGSCKASDGVRTAADIQRGAVTALLRYVEFTKTPLHRSPPDTPSQAMQTQLHCCVRRFLPPQITEQLSQHYAEMISAGVVTFGDRRTERYFTYNDPVARLLMAQYAPYIAELVGFAVKPSYTYMISYRDESELLPHQDREQAEIVVSIQLDLWPHCDYWPLFIGAEPQKPQRGDAVKPPAALHRKHILNNGDAVVFRGRQMIHWREKIAPGTKSTMLLIHYVHENYSGALKRGMNE